MIYPSFRQACALASSVLSLAVSAPAAEVFQVTRDTQSALPSGKEADGMIGDWLLRNDRVVAVIGKTSDWRDANQMVEGVQGAVLDFTSLAENNDQLVVLYPMGYRPTGVSANRAEVRHAKGAAAELDVVRDPTEAEPYRTTTTYTLKDGEAFLRIRTRHENTSGAPVTVAAHDWLRLDNDIVCVQSPGDHPVVGMDNPWYAAAYGLASSDGRTQPAVKNLTRRNLREIGTLIHYPGVDPQQQKISLAPGAVLETSRYLLVARDLAGLQFAAAAALAQTLPAVTLTLTEPDGRPAAGVFCTVRGEKFVTTAISDANGAMRLPLADGSYEISCEQPGRTATTLPLAVSAGQLAGDRAIKLSPQSFVTLDVTEAKSGDRIPVKIEFRGRNGTANPQLGPQKRGHGAGNLYYSARGNDRFPVPAGDYDVHISRGPKYEVIVQTLTLAPGSEQRVAAQLRREFDTPGWIVADFHSHSTGSGDSAVERPARVLNLAGAGIEFAPATEHNRISSYTSVIEALGLTRYIASAASIELSGRPGPGDINHQIAFPLEVREDLQGYGAPRTDVDPSVQMKRLYELDNRSPKLMQQNHPNIGWLYHDRDRDGTLDGGFGTRAITDVMEIREAMHTILADTAADAPERRGRAFYWLQMLNQGDRIYGTANTDSHNISPVSGSLFNYVRVDTNDIARLDPWAVARATKRGHVIMSNGPFLDVTLHEAIPGDTVKVPGGAATLRIKASQASWSRLDRVQILVNGRQLPEGNFTRAKTPSAFKDGVLQFEHTVTLNLPTDAHLIVVATSENETMARLSGGKFADLHPIAMSNPIFVDVDGDGFTPNQDTLGQPLPDGKPRANDRANNSD